jgi:hypothetical protein
MRLFECEEKSNRDKIVLNGDIDQIFRGTWSASTFDVNIIQDGKEVINKSFNIYPQRSSGRLYQLKFWGSMDLVIDTFPDSAQRLRYGSFYDAEIRINGFNDNRWYDKVECQYIGF